jgi:hypothetical protein
MKKYFLIKSIQTNKQKADEEGWTQYTISPITNALKSLPKMIDEYNEGEKRKVSFEVCGVKGQETAVIMLRGSRARVKYFPTALTTNNFYEYFSLREVEFPDSYL